MRRLAALLVLVLAAACSGGAEHDDVEPVIPTATLPLLTPPPAVYPGADWARAEPGGDVSEFARATAGAGSTCALVVDDGTMVFEADTPQADTPRAVYSITKSIVSVLVGIAADDGDLALSDPVARYVPDWRGTPSEAVTVRDLLANVSGRTWDYDADYGQMIRSAPDKTAFSVALGQEVEPGKRWVYNNSAIQVLEAVLSKATGLDVIEFAQDRLLRPLGMSRTTWARDPSGNPMTFSGVTSTCRDLARFGLLLLRQGEWRDEQIVSREYLADATGRASSALNAAYGYLFWLNRPGRVVEVQRAAGFARDVPPYEGRLARGVPEDAYWAFGYGNEFVAVIPSSDVVAVRLGPRPATPEALTFDSFTRSALAAAG